MNIDMNREAQEYLGRLSGLLQGIPAAERTELLRSIEEHLEAASTADDLEATLERLGRPEDVADAARAEFGAIPREVPGAWIPRASVVLSVAAIAIIALLGAALCVVGNVDEGSDWALPPIVIPLGFGTAIILGVAASLIGSFSRAWRAREKAALVGLWLGALTVAVVAWASAPQLPASSIALGLLLAGGVLVAGIAAVSAAVALGITAVRRSRRGTRSPSAD